jgi:hypothetical protein
LTLTYPRHASFALDFSWTPTTNHGRGEQQPLGRERPASGASGKPELLVFLCFILLPLIEVPAIAWLEPH